MRAVMQETLGILASGSLEQLILGQEPAESALYTYQDLGWLRPRFAPSSWRVTLGKLVERRLVIKTTLEGRVAFQMTKQGWEQFRELYPVFSAQPEKEWTLLLLQPIKGQINRLDSLKTTLVTAGYVFLSTYTAILPRAAYSDYLYQAIRAAGYRATFIPFSPERAKPLPIAEYLQESEGSIGSSRELAKISREIENLLTQSSGKKGLKNQTKEHVGTLLISGLSFFSRLNWTDLEIAETRKNVTTLAQRLDALMQEYSEKNHAWEREKHSRKTTA